MPRSRAADGLVGVGVVVHGPISVMMRRNGDITSSVPMYYSVHQRTAASAYPVRAGCTCSACEFLRSPPAAFNQMGVLRRYRPKLFIHISDLPVRARDGDPTPASTFVIRARGVLSLAMLVVSLGAVASFEDSRQALAAYCAMVAIDAESRIEFRGVVLRPPNLLMASIRGGAVSIDPRCRLTCREVVALHYMGGSINRLYPLPAADSTLVFAYKSVYERGLGTVGEKTDYEWFDEPGLQWQKVFYGARRTHMAPQTPAAAASASAQARRRRPRSTGQFTDDPNSDEEDEYLEEEEDEEDSEGEEEGEGEEEEDEQSGESEGGYPFPPGPWQRLPPPEYHDGEEDEDVLSELSPESVQEDGEEEEEPIPYIEPEPRKCKKRTWTEAENYLLTEPSGKDTLGKPCTPTDCLVCQTPATVMMLPCRHVAYCVACTKSPKNATPDKCPFCRADVGTHVLAKLLPLLRPCQS